MQNDGMSALGDGPASAMHLHGANAKVIDKHVHMPIAGGAYALEGGNAFRVRRIMHHDSVHDIVTISPMKDHLVRFVLIDFTCRESAPFAVS